MKVHIHHLQALFVSFIFIFPLSFANALHLEMTSPQIYPNLSTQAFRGLIIQRDILKSVRLSQLPSLGVNFTQVLLPSNSFHFGNSTEMENYILVLLNSGIGTLGVDIFFESNRWKIYNTDLSFAWFLSIIQKYIGNTQSEVSVTSLFLLLKVRYLGTATEEMSFNTTTMNGLNHDIEANINNNKILSPQQQDTNQTWPTLNNFLYSSSQRLVIFNAGDDTYTNTVFRGNNTFVFTNEAMNYLHIPDQSEISIEFPVPSNLNFPVVASDNYNETSIRDVLYNGYTPLISNPDLIQIPYFLNSSLIWGWKKNQPSETYALDPFASDTNKISSFACASLQYDYTTNSSYWEVNDCYQKLPILCHNAVSNEWYIPTMQKAQFFSITSDNDQVSSNYGCPEGYLFNLPTTPLAISELNYAFSKQYEEDQKNFYFKKGTNNSIWIDLNSVSASNCWVVGGSHAICPYAKYVTSRNFVKMVLPLACCIGALLLMVIMLKFRKLPIQNNRRRWKRIVKESEKNAAADGVPS
ncbi:hypothetical protein ACO0RG_002221 [Hanseniaspora osmophila]|uniref:Maintenance of telomere capping protein 6 n=1 Tax=Hanseniaspora osmophila TaxID=56408 RepID=A0A1E5RGT1_9ASCO|nr:Maintenance of telomere capping protein 6 [Hanseniaspora osmophila]